MPEFSITPEIIVSVTGAAASLIFAYFPILRTWFAALRKEAQSGIMIGLMAATCVVMYLLNCNAIINAGIACSQDGVVRLIFDFILALMANQGTYSGFKALHPADVQQAKAAR